MAFPLEPRPGFWPYWGSRSGGTAIAEPPATFLNPFGEVVPGAGGLGRGDAYSTRANGGDGGFEQCPWRRTSRFVGPVGDDWAMDRKSACWGKSGMMAIPPRSAPPRDPNPRMLEIEARSEFDIGRKTSIDIALRATPPGLKRAALKGLQKVAGGWSAALPPDRPPQRHAVSD
jgi:hypothetical protein